VIIGFSAENQRGGDSGEARFCFQMQFLDARCSRWAFLKTLSFAGKFEVSLGEGTFTEGHALDAKWQVPKEMIGKRLSQGEAKRLLTKFG
jgi:hypothetical protein